MLSHFVSVRSINSKLFRGLCLSAGHLVQRLVRSGMHASEKQLVTCLVTDQQLATAVRLGGWDAHDEMIAAVSRTGWSQVIKGCLAILPPGSGVISFAAHFHTPHCTPPHCGSFLHQL